MIETLSHADTLGFDGIVLPEHLFTPPEHIEQYGNEHWYDPFIVASYLAARTTNLRLVFKVLVIPLRHPLHTARMAATLDQLSRGRLTIGVASGWAEADFVAVGASFPDRGKRTDEYLDAMRGWWTEEAPTASGTFGSYANVIAQPRCLQRPHVPLWIGGSGAPSVRRAALFGDGWAPMPSQIRLKEASQTMVAIRQRAANAGRRQALDFVWRLDVGRVDPAKTRIHRPRHNESPVPGPVPESPAEVLKAVRRLASYGVTVIEVSFVWSTASDYRQRLDWIARNVIAEARAARG
jgi:probable F420-dependent oxidoreductase